MRSCSVRSTEEQIEFTLRLNPFITDWNAAPPKFFAGLTHRLHDLHALEPQDCGHNSSGSLADVWCRCRLFGGAATATLRTSEVCLRFDRVQRQVHPIVYEAIRRTLDLIEADFSAHQYETGFFTLNQHVLVIEDLSADAFLDQFKYPDTILTLSPDSELTYQPSVRVLFSNDRGTVNRVIEKSAAVDGGLFVSTNIVLNGASFTSDTFEQVARGFIDAVDDSVGLTWEP